MKYSQETIMIIDISFFGSLALFWGISTPPCSNNKGWREGGAYKCKTESLFNKVMSVTVSIDCWGIYYRTFQKWETEIQDLQHFFWLFLSETVLYAHPFSQEDTLTCHSCAFSVSVPEQREFLLLFCMFTEFQRITAFIYLELLKGFQPPLLSSSSKRAFPVVMGQNTRQQKRPLTLQDVYERHM